MKTLKRFVLVGAPASGKGTQSSFLSETYDLKPLSTGALLRAEIAAGSELGLEAKKYMDAAMFVPDEVVNGIVAKWLGENKDCGCLLDGYPRTVSQAETLDANLSAMGLGRYEDPIKYYSEYRKLKEGTICIKRLGGSEDTFDIKADVTLPDGVDFRFEYHGKIASATL